MIPTDIRVDAARADGGQLEVRFAPDGHVSLFPASACESLVAPSRRAPATWDASSLTLNWHAYGAIAEGGDALVAFLTDCDDEGLALLRGVPTVEGSVTRVVELFGYVRETNYGRLFDVRTVIDPSNLANTSLALGAHTDNPYRDPVPTLQLLHCLASSIEGGTSTFVDGYRVAEELARRDPNAFELLTTVPIRFRYADQSAELETWAPVIELDPTGGVRAIRFNTRSAMPPAAPADVMGPWYAAYGAFARLLRDPSLYVEVDLLPGDLVMFDNRRILHGRTGYDPAAGARHLQGCYADVDALRSKVAVLTRAP